MFARRICGMMLLMLMLSQGALAQDIHFSQTDQAPLLQNPGSTGLYYGLYRAALNYKNQWAVMGKPYNTFMASFDMPFENDRNYYGAYLGLGGFVFTDKAGDSRFSTTQADVSVSCIIPMGESHFLSTGLNLGLMVRSIDISAIQWPNQYDGQNYNPDLPSNEDAKMGSFFHMDAGAGIVYQYLNSGTQFHGRSLAIFQIGAALLHANRVFQRHGGSPDYIYPRFVAHTSLRYDFNGSIFGINPSVYYMKQGPAYEFGAGFLLRIKTGKETNITGLLKESSFLLGIQYRHKDAIIPQLFFEIADFGLGLSYDLNVSTFSSATRKQGGLEISVRYMRSKGPLYRNRH